MAITERFIVPPAPTAIAEKPYIYPWEHTELMVLCKRIYELAVKTGYTDTLEEFKKSFGKYLQNNNIIITPDNIETYVGQYEVIPLPLVEQILNTEYKLLEDNIIIQPIPYHQVDNHAGGRTVTIG